MSEMPPFLQPMLAKLSALPVEQSLWAFEVKWDGVRAIDSQSDRLHGPLPRAGRPGRDARVPLGDTRRGDRLVRRSRPAELPGPRFSLWPTARSQMSHTDQKHPSHRPRPRHSFKLRPLFTAVVFSLLALYLAQIAVRESVEGHVSTSRSWYTAIVIAALALLAAWRAIRSWRRLINPHASR